MHRQISVTLAVSLLGIAEPRVTNGLAVDDFFLSIRKRTQRLGKDLEALDANGDLSRASPEERPGDSYDVTEIEMTEQ